MSINWDDLRHVLSVARTGTLSAAAERLGVNQTTVARRLAAIERALGARLFDRVDRRLVATAVGAAVVTHAEAMEGAAELLERSVAGRDATLSGTVRLTSVESLLAAFVVPRLPAFRRQYPDIALELIGDNTNLNLARREADIALRLARPRTGTARTRRLADIGFAVFASAAYMRGRSSAALSDLDWIGHDETLSHLPEAIWCRRAVPRFQPVLRCNGVHAMVEGVKAGLGVGILPCYRGDREPDLLRLTGDEPVVRRELWLLVHAELLQVSRVRTVVDWLAALIGEQKRFLAGRQPGPGRTDSPRSINLETLKFSGQSTTKR